MAVEHPKVSPLERGHNQTTMISSGHRSYQNADVLPKLGDRMYICQLCKEKFVGKKQLIQHCHWHISQDARTSKKTILSEHGQQKSGNEITTIRLEHGHKKAEDDQGPVKRAKFDDEGREEDMVNMPPDPLELSGCCELPVLEPKTEGFGNGLNNPLQDAAEEPTYKDEPTSILYDLDGDIDVKYNIV